MHRISRKQEGIQEMANSKKADKLTDLLEKILHELQDINENVQELSHRRISEDKDDEGGIEEDEADEEENVPH